MSTTTSEPATADAAGELDTPPGDDTPPDDTGEPDEPGQQPEGQGDPGEPDRATLRSFEAELERHEREVREIMGPWMPDYGICPECSGVGLVPPAPTVKDSPLFQACKDCNGYGAVKTGALNPEHATRPCPGCKGRGYLEALAADGSPLAGIPGMPDTAPAPAPTGEQPAGEQPAPASFGTPAWLGDPSIGR